MQVQKSAFFGFEHVTPGAWKSGEIGEIGEKRGKSGENGENRGKSGEIGESRDIYY